MHDLELPMIHSSSQRSAYARQLEDRVKGDVRFDRLTCAIYATDASIYQVPPCGIVCPKDVEDVVETIRACRMAGIPVIPRGAGTGLTGGAIGEGVVLDLSRYMNKIGQLDLNRHTIVVQPGVVLDELNGRLAPHGLHFAPDVATASRATIGGMIANNSCGAHSICYGRTVDHLAELTVVLGDGEIVTFHREPIEQPRQTAAAPSRNEDIERALAAIRDQYHAEIVRRFPKVKRSNGGYGLDRLGVPGEAADAIGVLCGSEGTLGVIVSAVLRLVPLPKHRELVLLHFAELLDALAVVPNILTHRPSAVELIDRMIIEAGRSNATIGKRCGFLKDVPEALLAVEFFADDAGVVGQQLSALINDASTRASALAVSRLANPSDQAAVWDLRNAGLGLMMSQPGDEQPYSFVEDTAVDPSRLREYIAEFGKILDRENVSAGYYAHAGAGCLHVKPVLNFRRSENVECMRRIAEAVCDLAVEFGGTMTGEHGDGIVRSCWLERMYGPDIIKAFREVKQLFDPDGLMNPHKIVDPWPMTERLRFDSNPPVVRKTQLDFSAFGGMAGLAGMCSGVGQCRRRQVGTMCPSYIATGDEMHTTRARANALRMALTGHELIDGLDDPALEEVMDLCLSCKACKTECPTGVDMARLKAEWQSAQNLAGGVPRRSRLVADAHRWAERGSRFPRLANMVAGNRFVRAIVEKRFGLDRRMPPPKLARRTFRNWLRAHRRKHKHNLPTRGPVMFFVDTWTNYFTPRVGRAAVMLLEAAGYQVYCPPTVCCGRPAISKGLLTEAAHLAEVNARALAHAVAAGVPIIGTEPSCLLTLADEYPQLLRSNGSKRIAAGALMIETFLDRLLADAPDALTFRSDARVLYHTHCHQKALVGSADAMRLLHRAFGERASEIPSGCCGMAGSFGHEVEHYNIARAIGEDRLFPAVRDRADAIVAVSGFSCRCQIEHHTDCSPLHLCELLVQSLVTTP